MSGEPWATARDTAQEPSVRCLGPLSVPVGRDEPRRVVRQCDVTAGRVDPGAADDRGAFDSEGVLCVTLGRARAQRAVLAAAVGDGDAGGLLPDRSFRTVPNGARFCSVRDLDGD